MEDSPHQRQAPSSATSYESSSASSTASPRTHLPPANSTYYHTPPSRPPSGLNPNVPVLPQPGTPPRHYEQSLGHPGDQHHLGADGSYHTSQGLMQPQLAAIPAHNQKRAYRQRRKDPSCDACRERKVKCDATDTTSCSECSSRNVRCQFTKETNRRMSSIKQVQDLEKQLHQARQEINRLRSSTPRSDNAMDTDELATLQQELPSFGAQPRKHSKLLIKHDLSRVRANIRKFGHGVIRVPPPYSIMTTQQGLPRDLPDLPSKNLADTLIERYHDCVHSVFPILHWPTFQMEYNQLYSVGHVRNMPREWTALFFIVLAVGSLYMADVNRMNEGKQFLGAGNAMIDYYQDIFSLDRARISFLTSVFLMEMNLKSASWVWLGVAIRVAQDVGLHVQSGPWSPIEGEMRKRLWFCLYAWDRFLALELGKPMVINDQDFDVDHPEPVDDRSITAATVSGIDPSRTLLAIIKVARSLQQTSKIFKLPFIAEGILQNREQYLHACMTYFPRSLFNSEEPLDPQELSPIFFYQNARLMLHRHNLSPSAPSEARLHAVHNCTTVAKDTSQLLSRSMIPANAGTDDCWRQRLAASATSVLCTHLWRCTLILLLAGHYDSALLLVRASAVVGVARPVNNSCGRYISFYLSALFERLENRPARFDQDEEMLAYASGDLQASLDGSWIWQGSETGTNLNELMRERSSNSASPEIWRTKAEHAQSPQFDDDKETEWGGWQKIEQSVRYLVDHQHQYQQHYQHQPQSGHHQNSHTTLPPLQTLQNDVVPRNSSYTPDMPRLSMSSLSQQPAYPIDLTKGPDPNNINPQAHSPSKSRMNISHLI